MGTLLTSDDDDAEDDCGDRIVLGSEVCDWLSSSSKMVPEILRYSGKWGTRDKVSVPPEHLSK